MMEEPILARSPRDWDCRRDGTNGGAQGRRRKSPPESRDRRNEAERRGTWPAVVAVACRRYICRILGECSPPFWGESFDREEVDLRVARQGTDPDKQLAQLLLRNHAETGLSRGFARRTLLFNPSDQHWSDLFGDCRLHLSRFTLANAPSVQECSHGPAEAAAHSSAP